MPTIERFAEGRGHGTPSTYSNWNAANQLAGYTSSAVEYRCVWIFRDLSAITDKIKSIKFRAYRDAGQSTSNRTLRLWLGSRAGVYNIATGGTCDDVPWNANANLQIHYISENQPINYYNDWHTIDLSAYIGALTGLSAPHTIFVGWYPQSGSTSSSISSWTWGSADSVAGLRPHLVIETEDALVSYCASNQYQKHEAHYVIDNQWKRVEANWVVDNQWKRIGGY